MCEECGRTIEVGEIYVRYAGTWEGDFFTNVACSQCAALRSRVRTMDDYYFESYYGGLSEWIAQRLWVEVRWKQDDPQLIPFLRLVAGFENKWRTRAGTTWPGLEDDVMAMAS